MSDNADFRPQFTGPTITPDDIFRPNLAAEIDDTRTWVDPNGYRLSQRLWKAGSLDRAQIESTLRAGLAAGASPLQVARAVEGLLNPSYQLRRDPETFRPLPLSKQPKGVATKTPRQGPGRGIFRPRNSGIGNYAARRLARTETTRAFGAATLRAGKGNPLMERIRWRLSGHHHDSDDCDRNAERGSRGQPRGVYFVDEVPRYPNHPHEMCTLNPYVTNDDIADAIPRLREYIRTGELPPRGFRGDGESLLPVPGFGARSTSLAEAEQRAQNAGYPTVSRNKGSALDKIHDNFMANDERYAGDPVLQKTVRKNWSGKIGNGMDNLPESFLTQTQDAINEAYQGRVFGDLTRRFGDNAWLPSAVPQENPFMAGLHIGGDGKRGFNFIYHDPKSTIRPYAGTGEGLRPGASTISELRGEPALIRHEYGHHIEDVLEGEVFRRVKSVIPEDTREIRAGLSHYGSTHESEAFAEIFAVATDPDYRPGVFPDWVDRAVGIIHGYANE